MSTCVFRFHTANIRIPCTSEHYVDQLMKIVNFIYGSQKHNKWIERHFITPNLRLPFPTSIATLHT